MYLTGGKTDCATVTPFRADQRRVAPLAHCTISVSALLDQLYAGAGDADGSDALAICRAQFIATS
jgi:hypothetical protein